MSLLERIRTPKVLFDGVIAVGLFVLGIVSEVQIGESVGELYSRESDWLHIVFVALMTLPLVFRRLFTVPVFFTALGAWVLDRAFDYPESFATVGVLITFYTVGTELSRRRSLIIGGLSAVFVLFWTALGAVLLESVRAVSVITTVIATVTPLLIGREIHERRRHAEELRERAERAERDREENARKAVAEERARIARELHDVVAHQMTVMTVQAEGARRIADGADPRVVEALDTIKDRGHAALAEMRRVVGLLRSPGEDGPELTPLPMLDDVGPLVDHMRAAGVRVELEVQGDVRPIAEGTELSAYRVVQESLTNAVRHGGPDVAARVHIEYGKDCLDVLVEDNGRGAAAPKSDRGHGLLGMKERVAILGGQFEAGPKPGGGFRVHARIPVET